MTVLDDFYTLLQKQKNVPYLISNQGQVHERERGGEYIESRTDAHSDLTSCFYCLYMLGGRSSRHRCAQGREAVV